MSSGERKRMMAKPCACDYSARVACAVLWGQLLYLVAAGCCWCLCLVEGSGMACRRP